MLPGASTGDKVKNLSGVLAGVSGTLIGLVSAASITPDTVLGKVRGIIDANETRAVTRACAEI